MALNSKTYQPLQALTISAVADLPQFRFISFSGDLSADNTRALGVTEVRWISGQKAQVISLGTIAVEAAGTIATGDDVTAAASGKARKALPGETVNGRALDSASLGGFVKIKLVP